MDLRGSPLPRPKYENKMRMVKLILTSLNGLLFWSMHASRNLSNVFFKIPVALSLKLVNFIQLLVSVVLNEFSETTVTTTNSDDEFAVHDLGIDLSSSEQIVSKLKSPDWNRNLHLIDVFGQEFIDFVSLDSLIHCITLFSLVSHGISQYWSLFTKCLFQTLNAELLISQDIFESF